MKRMLKKGGRVAFWVLWPAWFIYFKFSSRRSRVLVVSEGKLLLIRDWLGGTSWGLPGGGAKRGEPIAVSAQRELLEEVGLSIAVDQLRPLGDYMHKKAGLRFRAYFFVLELDRKPELDRRRREVAEMAWFDRRTLKSLPVNADTDHALKTFGRQLLIQ